MTDVRVTTADTPARREDAFAVRRAVFVEEQDVDEDLEWDDWDDHDTTTHFVAYARTDGTDDEDADERPVGAARLRPKDPDTADVGKIERVAVLDTHRNRGIGRALMDALEAHGVDHGYDTFHLHSQTQAADFYATLGYERYGDEFDEAGIPHVEMRKDA
jgi:predicted GNAT family N-acyltransferase